MWEDRADRARREITALAVDGAGVGELHAAAIALVERSVPTELSCWATLDPESLMITAMISGAARIDPAYEPRLAEAEYAPAEPHAFAALARRSQSIARLSDLPERELARSRRLHDIWRPLGLDRELRVLFPDAGAWWGAAGLVRAGPDFGLRETEFLAAVAPAVGAATRLAVRAEAARSGTGRPAIVVIDDGGELRGMTAAARDWRDGVEEFTPGRFLVMMRVLAAGARSSASGSCRGRLRDARGRWAQLEASPLIGGTGGQIAITIEPTAGDRLVVLLLAAYGLSARERQICREVLAGHSTAEIADRLFISTHTVQDHLKSVFGKTGVRSRGELIARLRPVDA
ncbi:helix-turn-helix transcriptional regulator [Microlunatus speluncae]|uniref:helix-turn-helix transcriptional regulator n=1 Tax=Microlunatus speluncae TaxID=2594267 RepID=UPI0012665165|nr:helix-turn-helix transcriptional regulator [Microlunatus speluncae]